MTSRETFSQKIDLLLALTEEEKHMEETQNIPLIKRILDEICELTGHSKIYFTFPNLL